jgi:hypothetical protein
MATTVGVHGAGVPAGDTVGPGRFDGWLVLGFGFGFGMSMQPRFGSYVHQLFTVHVRSILKQASGTTVNISSWWDTASNSQSSPKKAGSP